MARDFSILKYNILPDSHPILRMKAQEVTLFDKDLKNICNTMLFTMDADGGIGLAAPQIGKSLQIIITRPGSGPNPPKGSKSWDNCLANIFINPKVLWKEGSCEEIEGCLSLKGQNYFVNRPQRIKISYAFLDGNGTRVEEMLEGWPARVFLHEYDHLQGILISDIGRRVL